MFSWIFTEAWTWTKEKILLYPALFLIDLYCFCEGRHNYWKKRNVPYVPPRFHYGNIKPYWDGIQSLPDLTRDIYNAFPDSRYVGYYQFNVPKLMVRDLDLIQKITKTDFEYFRGHRPFASPTADPLWAKNIFAMDGGQSWAKLRKSTLDLFKDGTIKTKMFENINRCATRFIDYFSRPESQLQMEVSDAFNRVTNDIIAATVFGHSCDSLSHRKNEFYVMVHETADLSIKRHTFFLASMHPSLPKWFNVRFLSKPAESYFKSIVESTITSREEGRQHASDIISELMESRKTNEELTNEVIAAIAVEFFIAGFDTTSRAMTFTAYELACNQKIQDQLRARIDEVFQNVENREVNKGKFIYDDIGQLQYLDMVVKEALRKWPPFAVTDRWLSKPYTIQPTRNGEKPVHLVGDVVCIFPIFAIHRDPKIYPNPETFDPERFRNRTNLHNFLPFGEGRRKCLGDRFATLEIKTVMFYLLRKFKLVPVENITQIPLVLSSQQINMVPEQGVWLELVPREDLL